MEFNVKIFRYAVKTNQALHTMNEGCGQKNRVNI